MTTVPTPYNPTFYRNPIGSYNEQEAYISVVAGTDALLMEDEINELQWLVGSQRAKALSRLFSSGSITAGNTDTLTAGVLTVQPRDLLVNGHQVRMEGQATNSGNVLVNLPTAPATGTRQDLVYLVLYLNAVSGGSTIKKWGYMNGDTINNDLIDPRIGADTTHRVQKQWNLLAAASTANLTALGYTATSYDTNLYTKANATTADGLEYAIPLYVVNRTAGGGSDTLLDQSFYIFSYQRIGVPGGLVKLDANGNIPSSFFNAAALPVASTNTPGTVRPGSGLKIAGDGTLTVDSAAFIPQSAIGVNVPGLDRFGFIPFVYFNPANLPVASTSSPGVVKGSNSISVAADGTLSATASSVGAMATNQINANSGVAGLDSSGKLPAGLFSAGSLPKASTSALGVVQVGTGLTVDTGGKITATPSSVGAVASSALGQANGVAQLNSNGQVPPGQVMTVGTTAPSSPAQGWMWFDTNTGVNRWKYYNGSAWVDPMKYQ